jgi:hypothetical protein
MSERSSKRAASPASDDERKSSRSDRKKSKKRSHSSDSSDGGSESDASSSTRKRSSKKDKKQKRKKSKREVSSSDESSSGGSDSEDEKKSSKKKKEASSKSEPVKVEQQKETAEEKKKRLIKEATDAISADMEEEEKKGSQAVGAFDPKAAAMHKLMTEFGTASKEEQMKMLMSFVASPMGANPDLKAGAAAVGPPQFPVQGKSNYMKQWFQLAEEKWALMRKGEEVSVTCPEMQAMLYDRKMRNNIHWTNFIDIDKTVAIWIKKGGTYGTFQTSFDKMQSFGGKKFEWPSTFVMQGPLMRCEFPRLGIEGNYDRLGKPNGPETIYSLEYQVSFTNEIYSQEMCDDNRRAFVVSEFFDMLDRLQSFCNRKVGMKGGFKDLENAIAAKCEAANAKIDEDNEKHGTKNPHETLPQTKADWISFIERHCMNNITSTDTNKNVRKTSFNAKLVKQLRKERKDPKVAQKDDKIIGKDAQYVPIDSPNKVFIKMFGSTEPENGKDMQRKRMTYRMLIPHRPDQVKLKKGEPMPTNPFPYSPVDFTTMDVTQGDVMRPTFSIDFYTNIATKTGMPKHLIDLEWHGRVGQLNDNPPTACNPLLAVPMCTPYTPPPKRGEDDDEGDEKEPVAAASSSSAAAAATDDNSERKERKSRKEDGEQQQQHKKEKKKEKKEKKADEAD